MTDQEFLSAINDGSLPQLDHAGHLRAAWILLDSQPLFEGLHALRQLFQQYATSKGAPQHFHETITGAFAFAIHEKICSGPQYSCWEDFYQANPEFYAGIEYLHRWYSADTLDSELARSTFVMPDRELQKVD